MLSNGPADWLLLLVAALASFAALKTLKAVSSQAEANAVSAKAAMEQAKLARQQLVGTLAAVMTVHHNLNFGPVGMHIGFTNEGGVAATDFKATIEVAKVLAPSLTVIEGPKSYHVRSVAVAPKSHATINLDIATAWIPMGKDSRDDVWDLFVQDPKTVMVTISSSYGNGFGDRVESERICWVYMPAYELKTRTRNVMAHHGGFRPCDQFADVFHSAKRQKEEAAEHQQD